LPTYFSGEKHCGPAGEFPLGWASSWNYDQVLMTSEPHDGFVPVRSALLSGSVLSNLERLRGNDPRLDNYPYPFDHTDLVDNPVVMRDITRALQPHYQPITAVLYTRRMTTVARAIQPAGIVAWR
jgi:hypothetical protein